MEVHHSSTNVSFAPTTRTTAGGWMNWGTDNQLGLNSVVADLLTHPEGLGERRLDVLAHLHGVLIHGWRLP